MKDYGKIRLKQEVHNSLVFYFMLSIYLTSEGISEENATESLMEFLKECRKSGIFVDSKVESAYLGAAWSCIPSGFLSLVGIEGSLNDGIKTIDVNYGWVNKL